MVCRSASGDEFFAACSHLPQSFGVQGGVGRMPKRAQDQGRVWHARETHELRTVQRRPDLKGRLVQAALGDRGVQDVGDLSCNGDDHPRFGFGGERTDGKDGDVRIWR